MPARRGTEAGPAFLCIVRDERVVGCCAAATCCPLPASKFPRTAAALAPAVQGGPRGPRPAGRGRPGRPLWRPCQTPLPQVSALVVGWSTGFQSRWRLMPLLWACASKLCLLPRPSLPAARPLEAAKSATAAVAGAAGVAPSPLAGGELNAAIAGRGSGHSYRLKWLPTSCSARLLVNAAAPPPPPTPHPPPPPTHPHPPTDCCHAAFL